MFCYCLLQYIFLFSCVHSHSFFSYIFIFLRFWIGFSAWQFFSLFFSERKHETESGRAIQRLIKQDELIIRVSCTIVTLNYWISRVTNGLQFQTTLLPPVNLICHGYKCFLNILLFNLCKLFIKLSFALLLARVFLCRFEFVVLFLFLYILIEIQLLRFFRRVWFYND